MHAGMAYPRWRGKRSRHSRRMRTHSFTYLTRGPWTGDFIIQNSMDVINYPCSNLKLLFVTKNGGRPHKQQVNWAKLFAYSRVRLHLYLFLCIELYLVTCNTIHIILKPSQVQFVKIWRPSLCTMVIRFWHSFYRVIGYNSIYKPWCQLCGRNNHIIDSVKA